MAIRSGFRQFVAQLCSYKDEKSLGSFLGAILTPKEKQELSKRLQIIKMLKKGLPQREIAEKLGVGLATVTRGSRELAKGNFSDI